MIRSEEKRKRIDVSRIENTSEAREKKIGSIVDIALTPILRFNGWRRGEEGVVTTINDG